MIIQLHDNDKHLTFAPLTLTRPVGNLRIGILTNDARWKALVPNLEVAYATEDYLNDKFPSKSGAITVNACVLPNASLSEQQKYVKRVLRSARLFHSRFRIQNSVFA
mgnify:CR=1 FL=1